MTLEIVAAMVFGTLMGVVVGAMPGLTTTVGLAVLIPFTFGMSPPIALGLMAGIYNGSTYGGAIPAILLNIPGTPAAVATTFDGYPMSQKGRSAEALKIACYSSALGGDPLCPRADASGAPAFVGYTVLRPGRVFLGGCPRVGHDIRSSRG